MMPFSIRHPPSTGFFAIFAFSACPSFLFDTRLSRDPPLLWAHQWLAYIHAGVLLDSCKSSIEKTSLVDLRSQFNLLFDLDKLAHWQKALADLLLLVNGDTAWTDIDKQQKSTDDGLASAWFSPSSWKDYVKRVKAHTMSGS